MLLIILISLPLAFACSDSQRIMKLSSETNAHGELYNGSYLIEICYNEIFGQDYTGTSPHDCDNNRILSLSATTNSHASVQHTASYSVDVCYGDLICTARSACESSEEMVVALSANSNAHLSATSDATYNLKICCRKSLSGLTLRWTDTNQNIISSVNPGVNVRMNVSSSDQIQGTINFTIIKSAAAYREFNEVSALYKQWTAGEKLNADSSISLEPGLYTFRADINQDGRTDVSTALNVIDDTIICSSLNCNHNDCTEKGCEGEFCEDSNDGCICMDYEAIDCYDLSYFTTCSDYETELSCQKDRASVPGECVWTSSGCVEETTYQDDEGHLLKCERVYTKDDDPSASGWQILSWIATPDWVNDDGLTEEEKTAIEIQQECVDGSRRIRVAQLKLPFFSSFSFFSSIALVVVLSYLIIRKNK